MSFPERRQSLSSVARWQSQSPIGPQRRKLSFNPVGTWEPPVMAKRIRAPGKDTTRPSRSKRVIQVTVAAIYCLFAAGIVFGYAALKPVLVAEGVYREKCTKQELEDAVWVCYEQDLRLNLMFTVAAVSTNVCALPVGTILDRYGPRVASLIGTVLLALGSLAMAFAGDMPFDGYVPGYLLLALGGPFVFISSFQLSNTFPSRSGLILALLTGAFDTSSAIFLVFRLLYQATSGSFNIKKFFLAYLVVPAFILLAQLFIMPPASYKSPNEEADLAEIEAEDAGLDSEITALLNSSNATSDANQEQKAQQSGIWGALHGKTTAQQLATWWFVLVTLFTVVQMSRINYFVATIRSQYTQMLGSIDKAVAINEFFDLALPIGGVIAVPFIGIVLDHTSTPFAFALLVTIATAIGIFGVIPQVWAADVNIILFVVYRPLYYTAVSDYSAKVFGFETFGKVYGLIICLAGVFNFSQAGLDALTHTVFDNNPVPVNIILLLLAFVFGSALVAYITRKSVTMQKDREAEEAHERANPNAARGRRRPESIRQD